MEQAKRVAKNTGFLYARMGITVFISLYVTRIILEALGANDFGLYNVVGGMVTMLVFLNAAMTSATQRFMSYSHGEGNKSKQRQIFNVSLVLHTIIAILVVILIELVGIFLFDGILKIDESRIFAAEIVFHSMVVSTFFMIISVPYEAVINAHENMLYVAIEGIAESVLKLVVAIVVLNFMNDRLILYGVLMAVLSIIILIIRRVYCHYKYEEVKINLRLNFKRPLFIEMSNFAGWSFLGSSTSMISFYGQGIVLNMFFGTIVNAAQGIAGQVSGQLGAFSTTMLKALNPVLSKSEGAGDRKTMIRAAVFGSKISFFLLIFFYVPILVEMPFVFNLWLTEVPEYTIIFCELLLLKNLIEQLTITLTSSIQAVGDIRNFQIFISIINLFPLIVGYIVFNLGYPPYSLYIVFIFYALFRSIIIIRYSQKKYQLPVADFLKNVVLRGFLSFLLIMAISSIPKIILDEGYVRFTMMMILNFVSFLLVFWIIGLSKNEKNYFEPILSKIGTRR